MSQPKIKEQFYNHDVKYKYWCSIDKSEVKRRTRQAFNDMADYEDKLDKDVSEFTEQELIDMFLFFDWVTARDRRDYLCYINSYMSYCNKAELSLPDEEEFKTIAAKQNKIGYVLSDDDLFNTIMHSLNNVDCVDRHYYDLPILYELLSFYGVSDEQKLTMKKTFVKDFILPTGRKIVNTNIQNFISDVVVRGGYRISRKIKDKEITIIYRRYFESELLFVRSYYVSDVYKDDNKYEQKNLMNQLNTQFEGLHQVSRKLKPSAIVLAGKFDREFKSDIAKGDTSVILKSAMLKKKPRRDGMTLSDEERYQIYKLFRLEHNLI